MISGGKFVTFCGKFVIVVTKLMIFDGLLVISGGNLMTFGGTFLILYCKVNDF